MNPYTQGALHHIQVAVSSILQIMEQLEESELSFRPTPDKHSIGELLEHLSLICLADVHIGDGASEPFMAEFYVQHHLNQLHEMQQALHQNYEALRVRYLAYTESELSKNITAYWGVTYTRYEWLLEILAHLYHHRGQLHAILVHTLHHDPKITLFE